MDQLVKQYVDFWERVVHQSLLNPEIVSQWQSLAENYSTLMTEAFKSPPHDD